MSHPFIGLVWGSRTGDPAFDDLDAIRNMGGEVDDDGESILYHYANLLTHPVIQCDYHEKIAWIGMPVAVSDGYLPCVWRCAHLEPPAITLDKIEATYAEQIARGQEAWERFRAFCQMKAKFDPGPGRLLFVTGCP